MKRLLKALFAMFMLSLITACYGDNKEDLYKEFEDPCGFNNSGPSYSGDIRPILSANCGTSNCHGPNSFVAGLDLNQYESTRQIARNGKLMNVLTESGGSPLMPLGGPALPSETIEMIRQWVEAGACEN